MSLFWLQILINIYVLNNIQVNLVIISSYFSLQIDECSQLL